MLIYNYKEIEKSDYLAAIICGDFNLIFDKDVDCYNYKYINNPNTREKLIKLNSTYNMIDYFITLHPNKKHLNV